MLQSQNYQELLSNTKKKSQLLKMFAKYLTQENTWKDLIGHTTLNIEKDTVLILQSQQESLFTSNQEEANTRTSLHGSKSSIPVLVKAKDTDILILMVYAFALTSPPYDWYLQIDHGKIVSIKNIYQNFWKTNGLCLPQFHSLTGCHTTSQPLLSNIKTCVFQRLLKNTAAAHLIEKLDESATVSENLIYQVMSFIQKYIHRGKTNEELVEIRMWQYNTIEEPCQTLRDWRNISKELIYKHNIGGII